MDTKLDKLLEKQAEQAVTLAEIKKDVSRNTDDVAEHMRRTEILEARVAPLEDIHRTWKTLLWVGGGLVTVVAPVVSWVIQHWMGK